MTEGKTEGGELTRRTANAVQAGRKLLPYFKSYSNSNTVIGPAFAKPNDLDRRAAALKVVQPKVAKVRDMYDFAQAVGGCVKELVKALNHISKVYTSDPRIPMALMWVLDIACAMDTAKMRAASLQNEFSYYRRATAQTPDSELPFSAVVGAQVSMYIAHPSPTLQQIVAVIKAQNTPAENVALADFANACAKTLQAGQFDSESARAACARAMVFAIVLFDKVLASSPYKEESAIKMVYCINQLATLPPAEAKAMRSVLKFSSRTYQQATAKVKALLNA